MFCLPHPSVTLSRHTRVEMNPDPPFFQTFGIIKPLRYFGILPFKVQTHENGNSVVDTVDWKIQLFLSLVFITLTTGFCFGCIYIVLIRSGMDFYRFFDDGNSKLSWTNATTSQLLDKNIQMIITLLSMFVGFVMVIQLHFNSGRIQFCRFCQYTKDFAKSMAQRTEGDPSLSFLLPSSTFPSSKSPFFSSATSSSSLPSSSPE